jgi:molybdopterin-guanine dinucleotide biosynthesis protein A
MTAGIVLAGGRSSRFGGDKLHALLPDGRSLLAHAVAPLIAVCSTVAIVVARDAALPAGSPDGLPPGLLIVADTEAFGGPVVGLRAGLDALRLPAAEIVLIAAGDMPTMNAAVLRLLATTLFEHPDADSARLEIEPMATGDAGAVMPFAVRAGPGYVAADTGLAAGDRRLRGILGRLSTVFVSAQAWRALDPVAATLRDVDVAADLPSRDPAPD